MSDLILKDVEYLRDLYHFPDLGVKSILLTGASGIIGGYMLASLLVLLRGSSTKVSVDLVSKRDVPYHLRALAEQLGATTIQGDLCDKDFLHDLPNYDLILHCAGYGQPKKFIDKALDCIKINTFTVHELLDRVNPGGRFLFLSSSEIYSGLSGRVDELDVGKTTPSHPRAQYIEAKRCGEAICNFFPRDDIKIGIARVALAYGPGVRDDDDRALNQFVRKALNFREVKLLDMGKSIRTYCYVSDIVEQLWAIIFSGLTATYNVGGISRISIKDLAALIAYKTSAKLVLPQSDDNALDGAPHEVQMNLDKVLAISRNKQFVDIEDGVERTIRFSEHQRVVGVK
jgi:UDP-glucuronate decarboxylase